MTALVILLVVYALGVWTGHSSGYDKGVRTTEAGQMLRLHFDRPLLRGRDSSWRRP